MDFKIISPDTLNLDGRNLEVSGRRTSCSPFDLVQLPSLVAMMPHTKREPDRNRVIETADVLDAIAEVTRYDGSYESPWEFIELK